MTKIAKNTICLWFDGAAEDAARFYAATFPDSAVGDVYRAPRDNPSCKEGDVLVVNFTVLGIPCMGINGGPAFKHSEAFSFQVATVTQEETDRYWRIGISNGQVCEKPGKPDSALGGQPMPAWMAWNWRLGRCLVWIRPALTARLALVGP